MNEGFDSLLYCTVIASHMLISRSRLCSTANIDKCSWCRNDHYDCSVFYSRHPLCVDSEFDH